MSDFHYDSTLTGVAASERDDVLNGCIKCLTTYCTEQESESNELKKIDVIVLTGDIASSGSIDDYKAFHSNFLSKVLEVLGLGIDKVLICAGNHDVFRDELDPSKKLNDINVAPAEIDTGYAGIFKGLIEYMKTYSYTPYETGELEDARDFLKYLYGFREIGGLNFVCLNSAWNCRNEKDAEFSQDYGKLFLGKEFICDALQKVPKEGAPKPIIIAITHHPFFFDTKKTQKAKLVPSNSHPISKTTSLCVKGLRKNLKRKMVIATFISNEYQWLNSSEVLGEGITTSSICQIEERVNLVLAGHMHKAIGPLVVGACGTSGYIAGTMDPATVKKKSECEFQIFPIEKNTGNIRGNVYEYGDGHGTHTFSKNRSVHSPNLHQSVDVMIPLLKEAVNQGLRAMDHLDNPPKKSSLISARQTLKTSFLQKMNKESPNGPEKR
jgi:predicted MPP superfamily phosphohydrolase